MIRRLIFLTRCLEKLDAAMALFHRLSSKVIIKCGFCHGKQMIDKQNLILFYMGLRHTLLGSIYIINIVISIQQQFLDDIGSIHIKVHIEVWYYDTDDVYEVYTEFQVALWSHLVRLIKKESFVNSSPEENTFYSNLNNKCDSWMERRTNKSKLQRLMFVKIQLFPDTLLCSELTSIVPLEYSLWLSGVRSCGHARLSQSSKASLRSLMTWDPGSIRINIIIYYATNHTK